MSNDLKTQPDNINFLSQLGLKFIISNKPHLNYFVQRATLPGLTLGIAIQPTPFAQIPWAGDLVFNDLTIDFRVDEDLKNYLEIFDWIIGLGFPENFEQYKRLLQSTVVPNPGIGETQVDGTLIMFTNQMVPRFEAKFEYLFPYSLSDLILTSMDADVQYLTATVTFKYMVYRINRLP
jgi:hypothetical protein